MSIREGIKKLELYTITPEGYQIRAYLDDEDINQLLDLIREEIEKMPLLEATPQHPWSGECLRAAQAQKQDILSKLQEGSDELA